MTSKQPDRSRGVSRRGLLRGAAASGLGVALGGKAAMAENGAAAQAAAPAMPAKAGMADSMAQALKLEYPFYGKAGQAGVATPPQHNGMVMTFDLTTDSRRQLQVLLARWSAAISLLMKGQTVGQVEPERASAVGLDTGEALDLGPAGLTVTIGLGPRLFTAGLLDRKPPLMRDLEHLPSDAMDPAWTGGDLSLQACAEDPQVAYHAIRDLTRIAKRTGAAETRWTVMGFGRASAGEGQMTPRNLFGFRDGTRNIQHDAEFEKHVWIKDGPDWQVNGTYQVIRKIEMKIENWDTDRVSDQNQVFGRHKLSGAPLSGTKEFDTPDFRAKDADGNAVIPVNSHIALAAHENNDGVRILRRSYNYTEGLSPVGRLDAGLLFVSYQNDPAHFEQLQRRLGASDRLNEYITHVGSGLFYVPPAAEEGSYIGAELFTSV